MSKRILFNSPLSTGAPGPGRPLKAIRESLERSSHDVKIVEWKEDMGLGPEADLFRGTVYDLLNGYELLAKDSKLSDGWVPDVYLGAGCASLVQMDHLRMVTDCAMATTWFSTHYRNVMRVMGSELKDYRTSGPIIHPWLLWRAKKEQEKTDVIIVPSRQCADTYEQVDECKGKTRVVEFGVDTRAFQQTDLTHQGFRVVYAGGNAARKGANYLTMAWRHLTRGPQDMLTLLGIPVSPQMTVKQLAQEKIVVPGWVPDGQVPVYLNTHDVFCLPSLEEGQALAVLEAMASGLPVVITKETGVEIEEGREGFYVPVKDPEAIRKSLQYLRDDPQQREEMGRHAREYAVNRPWEKFGDGVVRVLEEMA